MKGIALSESVVEERGLRFDRRWMLVDEKQQFLTQRDFPAMARIAIALEDGQLKAKFGAELISIPFQPEHEENATVKIWSSSVKAKIYGSDINEWFSHAIDSACRLVLMPDTTSRKVSPFYAVRKFKDIVSFADGYPFLLISQASLDDLNSRLESPVPMNRFRPNFVVLGAGPFQEDAWKRIRIGETMFHVVKPCARCVIPTIDQAAGDKTGTEPLRTLAGYRTKNKNVLFGQNLIADTPGGVVKAGDIVEIIETK